MVRQFLGALPGDTNQFTGGATRPARAGLVRCCSNHNHIAPGNAPPSIRIFWPVMYPAWAEHRKAHAAPNSSGLPKRLAGTIAMRSALAWSKEIPLLLAFAVMLDCRRSVS